ncbi:hypothetical protein KI387_043610, partial [Taxus chinensis]
MRRREERKGQNRARRNTANEPEGGRGGREREGGGAGAEKTDGGGAGKREKQN